jgi:hypothetical protein
MKVKAYVLNYKNESNTANGVVATRNNVKATKEMKKHRQK